MKKTNTLRRPWLTTLCLSVGVTCLGFSGQLLSMHISVLREVKDVSVPLVAQLSELEHREDALREQIELSQIQSALQLGSLGEKLDAYVLPTDTDFDRLVSVFDIFEEILRHQGALSVMSEIRIGDHISLEEDIAARPLTVNFAVHERGVEQILLFIGIAGFLTVGDVIGDEELAMLFRASEQESPTGIVALEQFLSQDLLRYAREPRPHEEQLRKSFTSPAFERALQTALQSTLLRDARRLFEGDFGRALEENNLWPVQFMTVREVKLERGGAEGWYKISLELLVWERS